jgi:IS5 family transposase
MPRRCLATREPALGLDPRDGHTLAALIEETQALTGREIERVYVDKGYRGHKVSKPLSVFLSGQKRGVFGAIKKELRRRSAIEAVIGHMKTDGHLDRNFLKGRDGDHANAVLTAVGYNLCLVLRWLRQLLRKIMTAILTALRPETVLNPAS